MMQDYHYEQCKWPVKVWKYIYLRVGVLGKDVNSYVSNHYSIIYYAFEFVFKSRDYHLKTQEKLSLY